MSKNQPLPCGHYGNACPAGCLWCIDCDVKAERNEVDMRIGYAVVAVTARRDAVKPAECPANHDELNYHGHSDCLNDRSATGPYSWIVSTWPCHSCHGHFAWMLTANAIGPDGDWTGPTAKSAVFLVPTPAAS